MEFTEGVGQDESVFESLAGPSALVRSACVCDVAEEADQGLVVGGRAGMIEDGPLDWLDELRGVRQQCPRRDCGEGLFLRAAY